MKYVSGRIKELKVGISSYSESKTTLITVGNVNVSGSVTATSFIGDGSALTNVTIPGISTTGTSEFTNLDLSGNGTGGVRISGFTFPTSDGSSGNFLKTNGAGVLSFASAGASLSHSDLADASTTVASSSTANMDTFATGTYRSAKYFISIVDSANSRFEIVEANVTHDGTNAYIATFGSTTNYTDPLTVFSADIDSGNVRVRVTNISDNSTVFKFQRIAVDV